MWAGSTRGPLAPPGKYQVQADRGRRHEDAGLRDQAQRGRADRYRRGPRSEQFKLAKADQRQGHRRQRGGAAHPHLKDQIADRTGKSDRRGAEGSGAGAHRQADRRRRGDLSVPQPQQPGSAQLSDPIEQQARGAAGHRRERRLQADRSVVRRVQGPVVAARPAARAARRARRDRPAGVEQASGRRRSWNRSRMACRREQPRCS